MNTIALFMALSLNPSPTSVDTQSYDLQVKHLLANSIKDELKHEFSFSIKTDALLLPRHVDQPTTAIKATVKADSQPAAAVSTRLSD